MIINLRKIIINYIANNKQYYIIKGKLTPSVLRNLRELQNNDFSLINCNNRFTDKGTEKKQLKRLTDKETKKTN